MTEFESPSPVRIRTGEYPLQLREAVVQFELAFLAKALDLHNGNVSRTAASLGVTRRTLQLKIKRCGLYSNCIKLDNPSLIPRQRHRLNSDSMKDLNP